MLRNSRIQGTRLRLPRATGLMICCLFSLSLTITAFADDSTATDAKEAYRLQQKELVQQARKIRESLRTEEIRNEWERVRRDYGRVLSTGAKPGGEGMKAIVAGLKYRIYSVTNPANLDDPVRMESTLTNLLRDLKSAGRGISGRQQKEAFRTLVCEEALPLLKEVMDKSYQARSFAIEVLPELKTVAAGGQEKRNIIHEDVDETLIEILNDPAQPDAVKVRAASSISAYLEVFTPDSLVEMAFTRAISTELESPVRLTAYQYFLVEALSKIQSGREVKGVRRRALPIETLTKVMQDPERDLLVRCRAAGALGQVGFDQQINFEPLAWKVTQLAVEASSRYDQNPKAADFVRCGWYLYLAFHHEDAAGRDNKKNPQGFLNRASNSQTVRDAYEKSLPLLRAMIFGNKVPAQAIIDANTWVTESVPANLRFDDQSDPVTQP